MSHRPAIDPSTWPKASFWFGFMARLVVGFGLTIAVIAAWLAFMPAKNRDAILGYWSQLKLPPMSFHPEILLRVPVSVQIHVLAVAVAMVVGAIILLLPKGTGYHRTLGWTWVISMVLVAATSVMMIADFNTGINPLHTFTAVTVVSLYFGLTGIRRGNVGQHAGSMVGLYVGGLLIAGLFAFMPGRTMWKLFFGG